MKLETTGIKTSARPSDVTEPLNHLMNHMWNVDDPKSAYTVSAQNTRTPCDGRKSTLTSPCQKSGGCAKRVP